MKDQISPKDRKTESPKVVAPKPAQQPKKEVEGDLQTKLAALKNRFK